MKNLHCEARGVGEWLERRQKYDKPKIGKQADDPTPQQKVYKTKTRQQRGGTGKPDQEGNEDVRVSLWCDNLYKLGGNQRREGE